MSKLLRVHVFSRFIALLTFLSIAVSFHSPARYISNRPTLDKSSQSQLHRNYYGICNPKFRSTSIQVVEIAEFDDEGDATVVAKDNIDPTKTDQENGLTHGYEGTFKVGDRVKVLKSIKIWSVKQYFKQGFECQGFEGKVVDLVLYGRKKKVRLQMI